MNPQYPVYIISKGRADSRLTSKTLERMNVPYRIVIEDQEYDDYAAVIDESKIILLDKQYQHDYDACDEFGMEKSKGSGPARNFVWDHSVSEGHKWHWIMDDNIRSFYRFNNNTQIRVGNGAVLKAMEDFVNRYENVSMAGPQYFSMVPRRSKAPPYVLNTKLYSCNLIRNDVPFRWRSRYNEDVDLSIRMLKAGWVTVQFNAFLQEKMTTQTMKGGNTDELYAKGTLEKSRMLGELHPDVVRVGWRFRRVHHYVDYRPFKKNKLIRKPNIELNKGVNNYGMVLSHG